MKNLFLPFLLLFLFFSCKNEPGKETPPDAEALVLETLTTERSEGDCANYEAPCAHIKLSYPSVKSGKEKLKKSVANWVNDFLVAMLDPVLEADEETSLESAIEGFVEMHRETVAEMPDLPSRYEVEVTDTILLQDEKHLTLRLDGYSYAGGAHPNAFAAIGTFNLESGQLMEAADFAEDLTKLEKLAEEHFRKNRPEIFDDGFDFDESNPFAIAQNVGLTTDGLFFCYVPYEVTPYALGFTEFVIPFAELK